MTDQVVVHNIPVISPWASKINWTALVSGVAILLTVVSGGALNISADQQVAIVTVIALIQSVVTWVMRTWFTKAIVKQSVDP